MIYGYIYIVYNLTNGKAYVGQTTSDPVSYWRGHLAAATRGVTRYLYNSIRKHGTENFTFEVIWTAFSRDALDLAEQILITEFKTLFPAGYNLMTGGNLGGRHVDEIKQLIGMKVKESWSRPGARERRRAAISLAQLNPETKHLHRIASLGRKHSAESKEKMRLKQTGVYPSDSIRKKIGLAGSGRVPSPETRDKIRQKAIGRLHTDAAKYKMSLSQSKRRHSPEVKAKISQAMRGKKRSSETKQRMKEAALRREARKRGELQ